MARPRTPIVIAAVVLIESCASSRTVAVRAYGSVAADDLNVNVTSLDSLFGERHLLGLRAELFMPGLDRIRARRQLPQLELSARFGDREVGMIEHAGVRRHPAVHVALDRGP